MTEKSHQEIQITATGLMGMNTALLIMSWMMAEIILLNLKNKTHLGRL